ncbi:MAG TPA: hypothetical protein VHM69_13295 [Rubrobacter sp.]|nr:hypothetical protein [Rubrobacter sp.]
MAVVRRDGLLVLWPLRLWLSLWPLPHRLLLRCGGVVVGLRRARWLVRSRGAGWFGRLLRLLGR